MDDKSEYKNLTPKQKIATVVFGVFCLVALIIGVVQFSNTTPSANSFVKDPVSGVLYSTYAGQPGSEERVLMMGFEKVYSSEMNGAIYEDMTRDLRNFVIYTEPDAKKFSYVDNSLKKSDGEYTFEIRTDTNKTFKVECVEKQNRYVLTISDKRGVILSYDSSRFVGETKDPQTLYKKHLPYSGKTSTGISFGFTMNGDGNYEIIINSCGNQQIKKDAIADVKNWLESLKYDPKEFNIIVPDRCPKK